MIFTLGKTANYERFFKEQEHPRKAIGGSVWLSYEDALKHCAPDYSVYGVKADWGKDTVKNTNEEGSDWHDLLVNSDLIRVPDKRAAKVAANFIMNSLRGILKKKKIELTIETCPIKPEVIGFLSRRVVSGELTKIQMKELVEGWLVE